MLPKPVLMRPLPAYVLPTKALLRRAEEAYQLARAGFDAGRISQLELRSIRSALISARNTAVNARLARVRAEVELAGLDDRAPF